MYRNTNKMQPFLKTFCPKKNMPRNPKSFNFVFWMMVKHRIRFLISCGGRLFEAARFAGHRQKTTFAKKTTT
jgi:hypothetical protein